MTLTFSLITPQSHPEAQDVDKVTCETTAGFITLLPRHIDCTAELKPSVLAYVKGNKETYVAVDGGILLKVGERISVSTNFAVSRSSLEELKKTVETEFKNRHEESKKANNSLVFFEAALAKLILELRKQ